MSALAHCRELTHVNISRTDITDLAVQEMAEHCEFLQYIDIGYNTNVTDTALFSMAEYCKELKHLNVVDRPVGISHAGILSVAASCTHLKSLSFSHFIEVQAPRETLQLLRDRGIQFGDDAWKSRYAERWPSCSSDRSGGSDCSEGSDDESYSSDLSCSDEDSSNGLQ